MKLTSLILMLAASTMAASAQAPAKPAAPAAAKPAASANAAKSAAPAAKTAPAPSPNIAAKIVAPASIPQYKTPQVSIFTVALRYQEIEVGKGAVAAPGKQYKILYTGYRASDGKIFDSTDLHPRPPVLDKDNKPVLGEDGKPKQGPVQPMPFVQGEGRTIPGFDQGFAGMKVGGKRRIFIPWQMGYGTRELPDRGPDHPGIPAKSDLIFDVTLVEMSDAPPQQMHPGMPQGMHPMPHGQPTPPPGTPGAGQPMTAPKPATAPTAGTAPAPTAPATAPAAAPAAPPAPTAPAQPPTK